MKQQTKGGALHRLWQALPWLWMAAAYLFDPVSYTHLTLPTIA